MRECRAQRLFALIGLAFLGCGGQQESNGRVSTESSEPFKVDDALTFLDNGDEAVSKVTPASASTVEVPQAEPACQALELPDDIPPEKLLERISRCLRTVEEEIAPGDVPLDGAVSLPDGDQEVIFADNGREIWFKRDDGEAWHIALKGGSLPSGARLLPTIDLDLLGPAIFPGGYAIVHPKGTKAWLVDHPGAENESFPLERAPRAKGKALSDAAALAKTVMLRYLKTCPSGQSGCLLFGPLIDVEAARDPAEPPGSWYLKTYVEPPLPEKLSWEPHPIERREGFDDGPYIFDVARAGDTKGVAIEVERAEFSRDDRQVWAFRHWVVVNGHREKALDLTVGYRAGFTVGLCGDSERLRVTTGTGQLRVSVSMHNRRTGKRLGDSIHVEAEPYHNICLAGDDGIYLYTVHTRGAPAFALSFEGSQEVALYFEQPDQPGRQLKVLLPRNFQPYEQVITKLTYRRGALHPTVKTIAP